MGKDILFRMATRIEPNWRLGTVQTSDCRYYENHSVEYMGSVGVEDLYDFLDRIPLHYFYRYFSSRDERHVDDPGDADEAQLLFSIGERISIDAYLHVSQHNLERLVGKICYCFDKNGGMFRGTIQKIAVTFEAPQTDHGFDYNRNARRVHIVYHVQTDDAHPEIVCKRVYFSAEDAARALSER